MTGTLYQQGTTVTSDASGNILSDGTHTYTWTNGRRLATVKKNGTTWTNTYDANGMRTQRSSSSTTYSYVYNGSQLVQMIDGNGTLYFAYGVIAPTARRGSNWTLWSIVTATRLCNKHDSACRIGRRFFAEYGNKKT